MPKLFKIKYPRQSLTKRSFDVVSSLVGIIILSPLLLVLSMSVRILLGSPILFKQVRPGIGGTPFSIYKFRSMTNSCNDLGELLPDSERLSSFGEVLRRYSLDELPELINVLKGEMSLVGPRPLIMEYLDRYTPEQARRNEVLPGITGWAQVNGRNAISWEEKFQYDVWYVDHQSLWLDIRILCLTLIKVFRHEGINAEGYVTASTFMGYGKSEQEVPDK